MNMHIYITLFIVCCYGRLTLSMVSDYLDHDFKEKSIAENWQTFKAKSGAAFTSDEEENDRMGVFAENYARIISHNAEMRTRAKNEGKNDTDYTLGVNEFSTLTDDEFKKIHIHELPLRSPTELEEVEKHVDVEDHSDNRTRAGLPSSFNWCNKNGCTAVKNQGNCGGCWAFSITGAIEGALLAKTGQLKSLSEQQLIDCTHTRQYATYGCHGGWPDSGFRYVQTNPLADSRSYPYQARETSCQARRGNVKIRSYGMIRQNDEEHLRSVVVNYGPVAIAMDASLWSFRYYSGGIYSDRSCNKYSQNHAVLVVGYGSQNGQDYWLIKNSWGAGWGERGYFKLARNRNNMCAVGTYGAYPILS